jgi:hypothetical protein
MGCGSVGLQNFVPKMLPTWNQNSYFCRWLAVVVGVGEVVVRVDEIDDGGGCGCGGGGIRVDPIFMLDVLWAISLSDSSEREIAIFIMEDETTSKNEGRGILTATTSSNKLKEPDLISLADSQNQLM